MTKKKKEEDKLPVGRPEEDLEDLPDHWQSKVLAKYKFGASDVEIKAMIWEWRGSFSESLWSRWLQDETEFSQTIKQGRLLSQVWWEKKGRKHIMDETTLALKDGKPVIKKLNTVLWYMNMKNRFGWKDKVEQQIDTSFTINVAPDEQDLFKDED